MRCDERLGKLGIQANVISSARFDCVDRCIQSEVMNPPRSRETQAPDKPHKRVCLSRWLRFVERQPQLAPGAGAGGTTL